MIRIEKDINDNEFELKNWYTRIAIDKIFEIIS